MILTKTDIQELQEKSFMDISKEQEIEILNLFTIEPDDYEWTEQDIHEQVRKILN